MLCGHRYSTYEVIAEDLARAGGVRNLLRIRLIKAVEEIFGDDE